MCVGGGDGGHFFYIFCCRHTCCQLWLVSGGLPRWWVTHWEPVGAGSIRSNEKWKETLSGKKAFTSICQPCVLPVLIGSWWVTQVMGNPLMPNWSQQRVWRLGENEAPQHQLGKGYFLNSFHLFAYCLKGWAKGKKMAVARDCPSVHPWDQPPCHPWPFKMCNRLYTSSKFSISNAFPREIL